MAGRVNLPHGIKPHPASHQSKITCTSLVLMNFRLPGQFHAVSAAAAAAAVTTKQRGEALREKTMPLFILVFRIPGR